VKANTSPVLFDHELEGDHRHDAEEGGRRLQELMKRIPDLKAELRDIVADRDKVIGQAVRSGRAEVRWSATASSSGASPTGHAELLNGHKDLDYLNRRLE
jgi:hypothetical protein